MSAPTHQAAATVTVTIAGGLSMTVPWTQGMNAQQALEAAFNSFDQPGQFTYALQYYGNRLGYLVVMLNGTYDTFLSSAQPFFYWEFRLNGVPSPVGIDGAVLEAGDQVEFGFEQFEPSAHRASNIAAKHEFQQRSLSAP